MGYSPFKMAPKSPLMKKLVGNQDKLPQQLQDAIKAAPESPAKKKGPTPAEKKKMAKKSSLNDLKKEITSKEKPTLKSPAKKYKK